VESVTGSARDGAPGPGENGTKKEDQDAKA
jgi:hypothetical protein